MMPYGFVAVGVALGWLIRKSFMLGAVGGSGDLKGETRTEVCVG
jgi:hypothetical protein